MKKAYYREQALERIARDVITAYDLRLYYGPPTAIPIEDIIEAQGLVLEYQYLRNNGRVLGETIFDDGLTAIYDRENHRYDLLPVKGGTILIDCSLSAKRKHLPGDCALPAPMSWGTGCSIRNSSAGPAKTRRSVPAMRATTHWKCRRTCWALSFCCRCRRSSAVSISCAPDGRINSW